MQGLAIKRPKKEEQQWHPRPAAARSTSALVSATTPATNVAP